MDCHLLYMSVFPDLVRCFSFILLRWYTSIEAQIDRFYRFIHTLHNGTSVHVTEERRASVHWSRGHSPAIVANVAPHSTRRSCPSHITTSCPQVDDFIFLANAVLTKSLFRSEGNLIHELGESTPARILLTAIQEHGLSDAQAKEVDFYIAIRDTSVSPVTTKAIYRSCLD